MFRPQTTLGIFVAVSLLFPLVSNAQFVPVRDQTLIDRFASYVSDFGDYRNDFNGTFGGSPNGTSDSIRDLIAGANPGGIAAQPCVVADASDDIWGPSMANNPNAVASAFSHNAEAYSMPAAPEQPSPWRSAIISATNRGIDPLPEEFPDPNGTLFNDFGAREIQVNNSRSLRCLLQELVEWKKLDMSLQIHMLLKQYIADAQTKQLANQAQSQITAAGKNFAQQGYVVNSDGIETRSPLLVTNYNDYAYDAKERQVKHLAAQISADNDDRIGTLGYCSGLKQRAAQQVLKQSAEFTDDPFKTASNQTSCSMADPANGIFANESDFDLWMADSNTTAGPGAPSSMLFMLSTGGRNAPLMNLDYSSDMAYQRANDAEDNLERNFDAGGGVLPTQQGLADTDANPYDIEQLRTTVTPADQNMEAFLAPSRNSYSQLQNADSIDGVPATSTQQAPLMVNTSSGVLNYDTRDLANTPTAVHDMVKELYDTMWTGYFDLHPYTSEWAQATMLMIYDEMRFNDTRPGVTVSNESGSANAPGEPPIIEL